jgi:8-oxo-dGTP diphosphatase
MGTPFLYGKYTPSDEEEKKYLDNYNSDKWKKASNTADIAVFAVSESALELLLVRRGGYPYRGMYCLPGGFINMDESLYETAQRELCEETGIKGVPLLQVASYGETGRDPRGRCITALYTALVDKNDVTARAGDDADDARWTVITDYAREEILAGDIKDVYTSLTLTGGGVFTPEIKTSFRYGKYTTREVSVADTGNIAFDHARLIIDAYEFLRKEVLRSDIAAAVLGRRFLLSDMKRLFSKVFLRGMEKEDMDAMPAIKEGQGYRFI